MIFSYFMNLLQLFISTPLKTAPKGREFDSCFNLIGLYENYSCIRGNFFKLFAERKVVFLKGDFCLGPIPNPSREGREFDSCFNLIGLYENYSCIRGNFFKLFAERKVVFWKNNFCLGPIPSPSREGRGFDSCFNLIGLYENYSCIRGDFFRLFAERKVVFWKNNFCLGPILSPSRKGREFGFCFNLIGLYENYSCIRGNFFKLFAERKVVFLKDDFCLGPIPNPSREGREFDSCFNLIGLYENYSCIRGDFFRLFAERKVVFWKNNVCLGPIPNPSREGREFDSCFNLIGLYENYSCIRGDFFRLFAVRSVVLGRMISV